MRRIHFVRLCVFVFIIALFVTLGILKLKQDSQISRLDENILGQYTFRRQSVDEKMLNYIKDKGKPGEYLGLYWLETNYGEKNFILPIEDQTFKRLREKWDNVEFYEDYICICSTIWNDVVCFPVAESSGKNEKPFYTDSWMHKRTYGGDRGHEGTDIMPAENISGYYPIISMTDGKVVNKGWLEKGGYRLGIQTDSGAYFYYAHLDSYADLAIGDEVKAGDFLGYMGDTGYGPEGTNGKFPVHLHLGIYIYQNGTEISINPYPVLRYTEAHKVKYIN